MNYHCLWIHQMKFMVISTCSVLESTEGMQREGVMVMMEMELG